MLLSLLLISCKDGSKDVEKAKIEHEIVIVDFYSDGCHACRKIEPYIDQIKEEYADVKVLKVDVNSEEGLHKKYDIRFIPLVIIYHNGKEVKRIIGYHEKEVYIKEIQQLR